MKLRLKRAWEGQGGPIPQLVNALRDAMGGGNGQPVRLKSNGNFDNPSHLM